MGIRKQPSVSNGDLNQPRAAIDVVPTFMDIILTNWFHQCLPFLRRKIAPTPPPIRTCKTDTKFLVSDSIYL